ncbi:MAG: hypothetical protein NTY46_02925 [Candidatus Sumerlaeota bacterium]|nr:hypothetical protein [Candidatus Sumerlaeota bacterium]
MRAGMDGAWLLVNENFFQPNAFRLAWSSALADDWHNAGVFILPLKPFERLQYVSSQNDFLEPSPDAKRPQEVSDVQPAQS